MFAMVDKRSRFALVAIVGLAAALMLIAPASATSVNQSSGRPGSLLFIDPLSFHNCTEDFLSQDYRAKITTGGMTVGPSASYTLPSQTISRWTYFEYSGDDGRNWYFWKWVYGGTGTPTSASGVLFSSSTVSLPKGYSYRLFDMFRFYSNSALVGEVWFQYALNDYTTFDQSIYSSARVRPTNYSAGCTVSS